jgi:hypothetical protein
MSEERMSAAEKEAIRAERPTRMAAGSADDREAEAGDTPRAKISPADLAMARAIIDAALARRS